LSARDPKGVKAGPLAAAPNGNGATADPSAPYTQAEAARRKANLELRAREAEIALRMGALCEMDVAVDAITEQVRAIRDRLLEVPTSVAPRLVGNRNVADIERILRAAVNDALEALCGLAREDIVRLQAEGS
jgi:hypothetical protein